jgi:hypothetical protein
LAHSIYNVHKLVLSLGMFPRKLVLSLVYIRELEECKAFLHTKFISEKSYIGEIIMVRCLVRVFNAI